MADPDVIRIRGHAPAARAVAELRLARPDLPVDMARRPAKADVRHTPMRSGQGDLAEAPGPPSDLLPLDALTGRLDRKAFADRLFRWSRGGRPYWLPHHRTVKVVAYNAGPFAASGRRIPRGRGTSSRQRVGASLPRA